MGTDIRVQVERRGIRFPEPMSVRMKVGGDGCPVRAFDIGDLYRDERRELGLSLVAIGGELVRANSPETTEAPDEADS